MINAEDLEFIFGKNGVMEMVERARKAGKVRFVGLTGHTDPKVLNRGISLYAFDTVLMPLSAADGGNSQKSFERETLPVAKQKGMGVIAMKTLGAGAILRTKAATAEECLRYAWSLPVSTAIVGTDKIAEVESNIALAKSARPLTASAMESLRSCLAAYETALVEPWKLGRGDLAEPPVYRAD